MNKAVLLFLLICFAMPSQAWATTIQSGPQQVHLLELYSSEGCSSCPPADEWVNSLKKDKGLWKEFVPVVFHVDYWDYLGWKDPYSSPEFSQRQRRYADSWGAGSVYTPGFVVNGREWRDWKLPRSNKNTVGILRVAPGANNAFAAVYQPAGKFETGPWRAHFAALKSGLRSDVKRGENAGRVLPHDFVVMNYSAVGMHSGIEGWSASQTFAGAQGDAIAVWVTHGDDETPVQAAGGSLT